MYKMIARSRPLAIYIGVYLPLFALLWHMPLTSNLLSAACVLMRLLGLLLGAPASIMSGIYTMYISAITSSPRVVTAVVEAIELGVVSYFTIKVMAANAVFISSDSLLYVVAADLPLMWASFVLPYNHHFFSSRTVNNFCG